MDEKLMTTAIEKAVAWMAEWANWMESNGWEDWETITGEDGKRFLKPKSQPQELRDLWHEYVEAANAPGLPVPTAFGECLRMAAKWFGLSEKGQSALNALICECNN